MKINVILFDYGGVVAKDHQDPAEEKLMGIFNVERQTIDALLSEKSEHGAAFREGKISEKEFWDTVYTLSNSTVSYFHNYSYSELSTLFAETYKLDPELLDLVQALRKQNKVGILTNIDHARSNYLINQLNITNYFDLYYPSYLYGSNKRTVDLWVTINQIIKNNYPNSSIVYIDDRSEHVLSANEVGWTGIKYGNIEELKKELKKMTNVKEEIS